MNKSHLAQLICELSADNGCSFEWRGNAELEALAAQLTSAEKEFLASGEESEVLRFVEARKLQPLYAWLNQVFDGEDV